MGEARDGGREQSCVLVNDLYVGPMVLNKFMIAPNNVILNFAGLSLLPRIKASQHPNHRRPHTPLNPDVSGRHYMHKTVKVDTQSVYLRTTNRRSH